MTTLTITIDTFLAGYRRHLQGSGAWTIRDEALQRFLQFLAAQERIPDRITAAVLRQYDRWLAQRDPHRVHSGDLAAAVRAFLVELAGRSGQP